MYCLSCAPPLSVLLFRHFPWTTTFMLTTHIFSSLSIHQFWLQHHSLPGFSPEDIFLDNCYSFIPVTLNSSKTEVLLIGLPQQLAKITSSLITTHSARNLGFIFDEHLTFSDQIPALSKSCYYHIREVRCSLFIGAWLDHETPHNDILDVQLYSVNWGGG